MQTFLFTDLVGFTALTAERGDDHAADVALDFSLRARELAEARGAEVVKTLGDGLMLRSPVACEGVHLGLEIVEGLAEVPGFPAIRAGIHTGPAVERQGDWFGSTVNIASRLCTAASGGEVLVSEATAHAATDLREIRLGERRLHWLKNVTEPVAAHPAEPAPSLTKRIAARLPDRLRCAPAAGQVVLRRPSTIPEALA